jgi:hypothetical protein
MQIIQIHKDYLEIYIIAKHQRPFEAFLKSKYTLKTYFQYLLWSKSLKSSLIDHDSEIYHLW